MLCVRTGQLSNVNNTHTHTQCVCMVFLASMYNCARSFLSFYLHVFVVGIGCWNYRNIHNKFDIRLTDIDYCILLAD